MDKIHSYLVDWTINFIKNRDIVTKEIDKIEKNKEFDFSVKYKDGKEAFFIVKPSIEKVDKVLEKINKDSYLCITILNNKNNLDTIVRNWKKLIEYKFLSIFFINPFSQIDKKWIIYPYTHHKICDESSLELGLKSMLEMVNQIDEKQLKARLS